MPTAKFHIDAQVTNWTARFSLVVACPYVDVDKPFLSLSKKKGKNFAGNCAKGTEWKQLFH